MKNNFHFNLILAWFSSSFQNKRWDKVLTGNLVAGVSSVCVPEECVLSAGWVEQISRSHLCWSRPITVSGASEIWSMLPISQAQNKPLTVPMGSDHVLWRMKLERCSPPGSNHTNEGISSGWKNKGKNFCNYHSLCGLKWLQVLCKYCKEELKELMHLWITNVACWQSNLRFVFDEL